MDTLTREKGTMNVGRVVGACAVRALALGVAALALTPSWSRSNGGPVQDEGEGDPSAARGGIVPLEESAIALISEKLTIRLTSVGEWSARAEYRLSNPGPTKTLQFGVPGWWMLSDFSAGPLTRADIQAGGRHWERSIARGDAIPSDEAREHAKLIQISVAGRRFACVPRSAKEAKGGLVTGWCVARIEVPTGNDIPLILEYPGKAFVGGSRNVHASHFVYELAPAGYWRGPAREVEIVLDPGEYRDRLRILRPSGATLRDGLIVWRLRDVDLRQIGDLAVEYDGWDARGWTRGTWIRTPVALSARASSTLAAQGGNSYAPERTVDADLATAWCEGKKGDGAGEWLEVTVGSFPAGASCRIGRVEIVPGYAKSKEAYLNNGRVERVRIRGCSGEGQGMAVDLGYGDGLGLSDALPTTPDAFDLPRNALGSDESCVRLVVERVRPGRFSDTCVSHFVPVVYCNL